MDIIKVEKLAVLARFGDVQFATNVSNKVQ